MAADGGANQLCELAKHTPDSPFVRHHGSKSSFPSSPASLPLTQEKNTLDAIVGDLDSLTPESRTYFESRNTAIVHYPDQQYTDFGKAIKHVRAASAAPTDIAAVGGLGGRVDQGISQLHHLYAFQPGTGYDRGRIYLVSEESVTVLLKTGRHVIHVREGEGDDVFGKHVGILPIREPSVITTRGLEWDVEGWETEIGGLLSTSNHVLPETRVVEVETSKDVLFTIALK